MTNTKKPMWLLDVDEVLNVDPGPRRRPPYHVWPREQWRQLKVRVADGDRIPVTVAEPVLQFIRMVHDQELATIKWHTSWQHDVHVLAARLSLPQLALVDAPEFTRVNDPYLNQPVWWKLPAVWREVRNSPRIIWTDDEIKHQLNGDQWESLTQAGVRPFVPHEFIGLTPKLLNELFAAIIGVNGPAAAWRPRLGPAVP